VPETTDTLPAETIEAKPAQTVDKDADAADEEQAYIALTQAEEAGNPIEVPGITLTLAFYRKP
jgi:hypothetical protein